LQQGEIASGGRTEAEVVANDQVFARAGLLTRMSSMNWSAVSVANCLLK
jgi:hypothetical protein